MKADITMMEILLKNYLAIKDTKEVQECILLSPEEIYNGDENGKE